MGHRRGFTLIELLVVVSIITLLMALLFPALRRARRQAEAVVCQANLHQWAMVFQQHTTEHDGRWFRTGPGAETTGETTWSRLKFRYGDPRWGPGIDLCPAETWTNGRRSGSPYSLNAWVYDYHHWEASHLTMPYYWRHVDATRSPGAVPVYSDAYAGWAWCAPFPTDEPPPHDEAYTFSMGQFCVPRHGSFISSLFMDWSVRKVGLKELWTLKWHRQFDTAGPWTKAGGVLPEDWPEWMRGFRDY